MSTKAAGAKKGPSAPVRLYLVAYNLISAISWAAVVYTVFSSLFAGYVVNAVCKAGWSPSRIRFAFR